MAGSGCYFYRGGSGRGPSRVCALAHVMCLGPYSIYTSVVVALHTVGCSIFWCSRHAFVSRLVVATTTQARFVLGVMPVLLWCGARSECSCPSSVRCGRQPDAQHIGVCACRCKLQVSCHVATMADSRRKSCLTCS
jgi:hypothetical protein